MFDGKELYFAQGCGKCVGQRRKSKGGKQGGGKSEPHLLLRLDERCRNVRRFGRRGVGGAAAGGTVQAIVDALSCHA